MPATLLVRIFFWLWFGGAVVAGQFLVLQRLPPVAVPATAIVIAAFVLFACARIPGVRTWINSIDLRYLVLIHITRFTGLYLLLLYQRGELPRAFAVSAAVGDIIVATMALPVALAPLEDEPRRRAIVIWNVVGFVGLLLAIVSATRIHLANPFQLRALTYLPLSLLPTFLMPLLLVTHVVIFARTARPRVA